MEKCVCGKEVKTERGLKLHHRKCEVFLSGGGSEPEPQAEPKPEKKAAPEVAKAPQAPAAPAVPPAPSPPVEAPPKEIPVGSKLIMKGTVWAKKPDEEYQGVLVDDIEVTVDVREIVGDDVWLLCNADGGSTIFAAKEPDVLDPNDERFTISQLAKTEAEAQAEALKEKMEQEEEEKKREAEKVKERERFGKAVNLYAKDRDAKLAAAKVFKKTDKENRPLIEEYTRKYGEESDEGKGDFQVLDFGYNVHLVKTPGTLSTEYDERGIVEWLLSNGHNECLRTLPNYEMWDNLKKAGKVPAEVIAAFETPVQGEDKFSLNVKKDKDSK